MLFGNDMPEDTNFLSPAAMSVLRSVENMSRYPSNRICLFGKPDPEFTLNMISEQFDEERERVIERWGFDILSENFTKAAVQDKVPRKSLRSLIEDKENVHSSERAAPLTPRKGLKVLLEDTNMSPSCESKKESKKSKSERKKSLKMHKEKSHLRRARQSHVTDYWRSRKFSESSSCSDKEN